MEKVKVVDKGGRRLGIDRRQLSIPRKGRRVMENGVKSMFDP